MAAIRNEVDSMVTNQVWQFVDLPCDPKPIVKIGVLKVKCWPNGSIDKYKASYDDILFTDRKYRL